MKRRTFLGSLLAAPAAALMRPAKTEQAASYALETDAVLNVEPTTGAVVTEYLPYWTSANILSDAPIYYDAGTGGTVVADSHAAMPEQPGEQHFGITMNDVIGDSGERMVSVNYFGTTFYLPVRRD